MDPRKTIKVLAILALIGGVLAIIVSLLMIVGGGAMTAVGTNPELMAEAGSDPEVAAAMDRLNSTTGENTDVATVTTGLGGAVLLLGIASLISGIFNILEGVFGLKAAKGAGAKPAFIIGVISAVICVISVVLGLVSGQFQLGSVISLVLSGLYVYCAKQIKDEEEGSVL